MLQEQVKHVTVPFLPEFSINVMWPQTCIIEELMMYMPDSWSTHWQKKVDRSYYYNVLNTVLPGYLPAVMADVRRLRRERGLATRIERPAKEHVVAPEIVAQILNDPYLKRCKYLDLLTTLF